MYDAVDRSVFLPFKHFGGFWCL